MVQHVLQEQRGEQEYPEASEVDDQRDDVGGGERPAAQQGQVDQWLACAAFDEDEGERADGGGGEEDFDEW